MLEIEEHIEAHKLSVTARPNCSMSRLGTAYLFLIITLFVMVLAMGFSLIGAWPVMIYAALVLFGLSLGFEHALNRSNDYERLVMEDGNLSIESGVGGKIISHRLHASWVMLVTEMTPDGDCSRLALRLHGNEVDFGRHLCAESRARVARLLKPRLGGGFDRQHRYLPASARGVR